METETTTWKASLAANRHRYLDELVEFLKIPSISAVTDSIPDVQKAAEWVAARLKTAGMENVEILPTGPHSCVYGDWLHAPGKPTILIYGHFDVQPPDPLDLWESPPFEPVIKDGRVYARGAADMKANLLLTIAAVEAMLAANELPVNIKWVCEGQEEIGSRDLGPFVVANHQRLACDLVLTPDGGQASSEQPAMLMGTKGLCALQIDIETAGMDMHSGLYGGAVPNANHALVELLGTFRDASGKIVVDGFYDQVVPLTDDDRKSFASVPFDEMTYRAGVGVEALLGEPGYTTYERAWARPTVEVNGMWGGYQGDGVKTVIPAKAHAKITCRLVANQEPAKVLDKLEAHIKAHTPAGARVTVTRLVGEARPYLNPRDHAGIQAVADVLAEEYGREPFYVRVGGSLPIMDMFLQELNAYTVVLGFAQEDERMHSPNEFIRLADFERGQIVYAKVLERLAGLQAGTLSAR